MVNVHYLQAQRLLQVQRPLRQTQGVAGTVGPSMMCWKKVKCRVLQRVATVDQRGQPRQEQGVKQPRSAPKGRTAPGRMSKQGFLKKIAHTSGWRKADATADTPFFSSSAAVGSTMSST